LLKLQTIDSIRLLFNKKGFILLTKEYTNSKQKLEYVCPNGHTHSIRLDHFRNGVGCPYCKNTFKKSIDFIKPFFDKLPPVCWYIKSKKRVKLKTGFRIWDCGNIIYKKLNNNEVNNGY
jgi:hypothetical protein